MSDIFPKKVPSYGLRDTLILPLYILNIIKYEQLPLGYEAANIWNYLPPSAKSVPSLSDLKKLLTLGRARCAIVGPEIYVFKVQVMPNHFMYITYKIWVLIASSLHLLFGHYFRFISHFILPSVHGPKAHVLMFVIFTSM